MIESSFASAEEALKFLEQVWHVSSPAIMSADRGLLQHWYNRYLLELRPKTVSEIGYVQEAMALVLEKKGEATHLMQALGLPMASGS